MPRKSFILYTIILIGSILLTSCGSASTPSHVQSKVTTQQTHDSSHTPTRTSRTTPTPSSSPTLHPTTTATPTSDYPPTVSPASTLGIVADSNHPAGIPWVRLGYSTCVANNIHGNVLKTAIQKYHKEGVRVLLSVCQWATDARLFNTRILNDAAQGGADAVQCGNEQMKYGPYNRYVSPAIFAKFFYLCQRTMRLIRPEIPVLIGSLDPHVGGIDYGPLYDQVGYLNAMQYAMNTSVLPGSNWNWRSQTVGLIDSWHNGYPDQSVNSLYYLFLFWAQQFGVNLGSGALGKHLWVVEGTGCVFGCGVSGSSYAQAVSHILTLISDVQTAMSDQVPLFYFSTRDFYASGQYWPMGIRDVNDHPKPLRQDLWMGARTLTMSCSSGAVVVSSQEQLLARMYGGCSLPGNYIGILES